LSRQITGEALEHGEIQEAHQERELSWLGSQFTVSVASAGL
jgi:hypothetical protein